MKKKIIVHENVEFEHEIIIHIDDAKGEDIVDEIMDDYSFTDGTDFDSIVYDLRNTEDVIVLYVNEDTLGSESEITHVDAEDLEDEE